MLRAEVAEIHGYVRSPAGADARRVEQQEKRLPYPGTDGSEGATYTACRFRDVGRGRCSIYPVRPLICRLFGHVDWLPCPIQRITAPVAGGRETMLRYAEAPRKTYEEWLEEPSPVA